MCRIIYRKEVDDEDVDKNGKGKNGPFVTWLSSIQDFM